MLIASSHENALRTALSFEKRKTNTMFAETREKGYVMRRQVAYCTGSWLSCSNTADHRAARTQRRNLNYFHFFVLPWFGFCLFPIPIDVVKALLVRDPEIQKCRSFFSPHRILGQSNRSVLLLTCDQEGRKLVQDVGSAIRSGR